MGFEYVVQKFLSFLLKFDFFGAANKPKNEAFDNEEEQENIEKSKPISKKKKAKEHMQQLQRLEEKVLFCLLLFKIVWEWAQLKFSITFFMQYMFRNPSLDILSISWEEILKLKKKKRKVKGKVQFLEKWDFQN